MSAPMEGIRVLDLTSVLFGPYCTMLLGDMGADVVKIEAPAGDTTRKIGPGRNPGMAAFFLLCNRNKRSVCLDLKHEGAREALWRLVETADVFIHSIRPQAIQRLGFGPDAVRARNPRIVYAGLHGFSEQGPYAGRPAYDDIIQGGSGLAALMEPLAGEPRFTPMVAADKTCGLMAVWAVAAALLHRERTGEGQFVEVPMFETMAHFNTMEHLYGHVFDPPLAPMGYPRVLAGWRKPYPTADGHLNVLAYNDGQWRRFVEAAGRPELAEDPLYAGISARTENVEKLYAVVGEILATRTTEEWVELLERLEIPYMRVNAMGDLPEDPHLKAVGFFRRMNHPSEGPIVQPDFPVRFGKSGHVYAHHPPRLGQHTAELLTEAGYGAEEIDALLATGAAVV